MIPRARSARLSLLIPLWVALAAWPAWASERLPWAKVDPGPPPTGTAVAAVYVGAPDGKGPVLLARSSRKPVNPASVAKIATAWLALTRLGPEHRFETQVFEQGGDLHVRAAGDPSLRYKDLLQIASRLHHRGHRSFRDVVVDTSVFGAGTTPPHFDDKKTDDAYRAEVGALTPNSGTIAIRVRPGRKVGDQARVALYPPTPDVVIRTSAKTGAGKKTTVGVETRTEKGQTVVVVRGRIPLSAKRGVSVVRKIYQANTFGAGLVKVALERTGVKVSGGVRFGPVPADARRLLKHPSPPLRAILSEMLATSNNFMAETLLRHLDPSESGKQFERGAAEVEEEVRRVTGVPAEEVRVTNGSGLYDANRFSARALGRLLAHAQQSDWATDLAAALALSGREGTLKKRLKRLWFRGKTGTLNQSVSLAGYLDVKGLGRVAVVVLLEGELEGKASAGRHWIDRLVERVHDTLAK